MFIYYSKKKTCKMCSITCECGKQLKKITWTHLNSKFHLDFVKNQYEIKEKQQEYKGSTSNTKINI